MFRKVERKERNEARKREGTIERKKERRNSNESFPTPNTFSSHSPSFLHALRFTQRGDMHSVCDMIACNITNTMIDIYNYKLQMRF